MATSKRSSPYFGAMRTGTPCRRRLGASWRLLALGRLHYDQLNALIFSARWPLAHRGWSFSIAFRRLLFPQYAG